MELQKGTTMNVEHIKDRVMAAQTMDELLAIIKPVLAHQLQPGTESRHVLYIDELGFQRDAEVTQVWSDTCVNLRYPVKVGNEIKWEQANSVTHYSLATAPGRYWMRM